MNTNHRLLSLVTVLTIVALLLSACGMAAAPAASTADSGAAAAESELSYAAAPSSQLRTRASGYAPQDMYFEDYGVNGFVATAQDDLSTFAVDVDTGSYTVARTYLTDGWLPPADSVRVEEFVNYFDYAYPLPSQDAAFTIVADGAPSPFLDRAHTRLLRIGIQGFDIAPDARPDVALTFVIDVSGSMNQENRLGLVKRALTVLVNELRPSDAVAIVVYGSQARLVLPMTPLADGATVRAAINSLTSEGSTNAEAGLRLAYAHAWEHFDPEKINRVVLASDGVANVGATGPEAILATIGQYAVDGLTLTAVGVGMGNYNDVLMEQLADQGDGFYAYIDGMDEARKLFVEDLPGTLLTIAKDVKVQVEFNADLVTRYRLAGYENRDVADDDFRNDEVDAGEIGAGHSVTALYEVELNPQGQNSQAPIATVRLRWEDPATGNVTELDRAVTPADFMPDFATADPGFQLAVVVAEYAENLRQSEWAVATLEDLQVEAERVNGLLADQQGADPAVTELVDLIWLASDLQLQQAP